MSPLSLTPKYGLGCRSSRHNWISYFYVYRLIYLGQLDYVKEVQIL